MRRKNENQKPSPLLLCAPCEINAEINSTVQECNAPKESFGQQKLNAYSAVWFIKILSYHHLTHF